MNSRRPFLKSAPDISRALGFRSLLASGDRAAVERRGIATSAKIAIPKSTNAKKNHLRSFAIFRATAPMADLSPGRRMDDSHTDAKPPCSYSGPRIGRYPAPPLRRHDNNALQGVLD